MDKTSEMVGHVAHFIFILATILLVEPSSCTSCSVSNITEYQHFDAKGRWHFDENNDCGFHNMKTDELVHLLRGKSVLFIGDSSVRNTGLALLASMCNPDNIAKCDQIMTLPFIQREGTVTSAFSCGADSPTNRCGDIKHRFIPLTNLTMNEFYKTHEDRRKFWKTKNVPPLLSMTFRDVELHILEAGCSNHRDGLWLILDYLLKYSVPFHYDMIVLSGGLHCSYRLYKGGTWYRSLFERFPKFRAQGTPIVWVEVTHCLKNDGGHYFKLEGKMTLNYRKLAACPFIDKHIPFMKSGAIRNGAAYVHTRHITRNLTMLGKSKFDKSYKFNEAQRDDPCPFMDPIHPTVECYGAIAQSLAYTLKSVVENPASFVTTMPLREKETLAMSAVQIGESFVGNPKDKMMASGGGRAEEGGGYQHAQQQQDQLLEGAIVDIIAAYSNLVVFAVVVAVVLVVGAGWRRRRRRLARSGST